MYFLTTCLLLSLLINKLYFLSKIIKTLDQWSDCVPSYSFFPKFLPPIEFINDPSPDIVEIFHPLHSGFICYPSPTPIPILFATPSLILVDGPRLPPRSFWNDPSPHYGTWVFSFPIKWSSYQNFFRSCNVDVIL